MEEKVKILGDDEEAEDRNSKENRVLRDYLNTLICTDREFFMDIILLLKTVLLGIVEGITEWLPISSTGHLILADEFIKLNMTADFKEMFDVVIQLGAIMAVVVLYFHKLNPFSPKKNHEEKMDTIILWTKVILAVFPAAIIGILFDNWLNDHFL